MDVQILSNRYTLSRSFHPFPSLCDLLLMVHKDNTQLGKFWPFLRVFACICVSIPYWQCALCGARACGAILVACYTQARKTIMRTQKKHEARGFFAVDWDRSPHDNNRFFSKPHLLWNYLHIRRCCVFFIILLYTNGAQQHILVSCQSRKCISKVCFIISDNQSDRFMRTKC